MFRYFRERPTGFVLGMLGVIIFLIAIRGEDTRSDLTTIEQDVYNIRSSSPCTNLTTMQCALKLFGSLPEAQRRAIGISSDTLRELQERNLRERNEFLRRQRILRQRVAAPPRRTVTIFSDPVRPVIIRPTKTTTQIVTEPGPVPPPTTITVMPPPLTPTPTIPPPPKVKIPPTKTPPVKTPPVTTPAVTGVTPTHTVPPVDVPQITLPCIGADPLVECERGNGKPTVAP